MSAEVDSIILKIILFFFFLYHQSPHLCLEILMDRFVCQNQALQLLLHLIMGVATREGSVKSVCVSPSLCLPRSVQVVNVGFKMCVCSHFVLLAAGLLRAFVFLWCSPDLSSLQSVISVARAGSPADKQNSLNFTSLLFAGTLSLPHINLPSNPNFNSLRKCLWEELQLPPSHAITAHLFTVFFFFLSILWCYHPRSGLNVWLIRCRVPLHLPDGCSRVNIKPGELSLSFLLLLSPSRCVCLPASPDNDQIHFQTPSPSLPHRLTGPHKQGHLGSCKRKMYHLLGNGWHDVLAKKLLFCPGVLL